MSLLPGSPAHPWDSKLHMPDMLYREAYATPSTGKATELYFQGSLYFCTDRDETQTLPQEGSPREIRANDVPRNRGPCVLRSQLSGTLFSDMSCLWRESPEATEFRGQSHFLPKVSPGWKRKSGDAHRRLKGTELGIYVFIATE